MLESTQHKLDRVRRPRVQITYDVEIGNAIQVRELPFVVGILADLSGMRSAPLPKLKDRKFIDITGDTFTAIMESISPRLALTVPNCLVNDETQMHAELFFKSMDDFEPLNVVKQIPGLAKLYEARTRLKDLLAKLDGNDELDDLLRQLINDPSTRDGVMAELGMLPSSPNSPDSKQKKTKKDIPVEE